MGTSVEITANNIWWTGTKERREEQRRGKKWMKSCWLLKVISLNSSFSFLIFIVTLAKNMHIIKILHWVVIFMYANVFIYAYWNLTMAIQYKWEYQKKMFFNIFIVMNQIMQKLPTRCLENIINVIQICIFFIRKPW